MPWLFLFSLPTPKKGPFKVIAQPCLTKKNLVGFVLILCWHLTSFAATFPIQTRHALAMHGTAKYPANFQSFNYVNPQAPKGGQIKLAAIGTFDTFNAFIPKGVEADGINLIYDTLTTASLDEPFSRYGLVAETMELPTDRSWVIFHLRHHAQFHDHHPITAEDVVFSFNLLRTQGRPFFQYYYAQVLSVTALDAYRVKFTFKPNGSREMPLIVGEFPILPKHYWSKHTFSQANLEIPLGSGPYRIKQFSAGKNVVYERVKNYWGAQLPVNRGRYNFDQVNYEYYLDPTVTVEALKAQDYHFRLENNSKFWATLYQGPPFDQHKIILEQIPNQEPTGMQGFIFNLRKPLFQDKILRQAMNLAFDFEWANKNLFYSQYKRTQSYFQNTELAATQLPSPEEITLLKSLSTDIPPEAFKQVYNTPQTTGAYNIRNNLRQAAQLLKQAGYQIKNGQLYNAKQQAINFEFLSYDSSFERILLPYAKNLAVLGIHMSLRRIDTSQYVSRLRNYDFDMTIHSFGQSLSPGNEQKDYWYSTSADIPDSKNLMGIKNPAVDRLVDLVINAPDRPALVLRSRALDRVLQWNYYLIPNWHVSYYRVAYWNFLHHPKITPPYGLDFFSWWIQK